MTSGEAQQLELLEIQRQPVTRSPRASGHLAEPGSANAVAHSRTVRVLCVVGARPNFMKVAPLLRHLRRHPLFDARLVCTGQHYDFNLSSIFLEELQMPQPVAHLNVGPGSHAVQTSDVMTRFEPVLAAHQPQVVVVVGDVNSTLACALVVNKFTLETPFRTCWGQRRRPLLAHVEAGLRSFDNEMPEESNRKLTDAISDLLYVSEPSGILNLAREGVPKERVVLVGNTMVDSLFAAREYAARSPIVEELGLARAYGVVTLHRPSNVDDPSVLSELMQALDGCAREMPLVLPLHPRTRARLLENGYELDAGRWRMTGPLGYSAFIRLLSGARVAFTDSGGVQDETTALGVPCLTLRDNTERPITVEQGTNCLVARNRRAIESAFRRVMTEPVRGRVPEYWDGRAAPRIVTHLATVLGEGVA